MPRFRAILAPAADDLARAAALDPANPFAAPAWAEGRARLGQRPIVLAVEHGPAIVAACLGFSRAGRFKRTLEIPSLPPLGDFAETFWTGLRAHAAAAGMDVLEINSFGSAASDIPALGVELGRRDRLEHVLDLGGPELFGRLSGNHRGKVRKARKAGVRVERMTGDQALAAHVGAINASMRRRAERGEQVEEASDDTLFRAMLATGAATLHQALDAGTGAMLSSALVLRAAAGAYLQTSGSTPAGLSVGSPPLLVHEIAEALRAEGYREFNLGGAMEDNPGLLEFKVGFGTRRVPLASAEFDVSRGLRRQLGHLVELVRGRLQPAHQG